METDNAQKLYTELGRVFRQLHRFYRTAHHSGQHFHGQSQVLQLVAGNDGIIQRDLAEQLDMRPSSLAELVSKLEHADLIIRTQDEKDQRVMHISLTEKGKQSAAGLQEDASSLKTTLFGCFSEEDISDLLRLTEKLSAHLNEMDISVPEDEMEHHHRRFGCGADEDRERCGWGHGHGRF